MQVRHCLGQYGNDVVHLGVQTHYDPSQLFALLLVEITVRLVETKHLHSQPPEEFQLLLEANNQQQVKISLHLR